MFQKTHSLTHRKVRSAADDTNTHHCSWTGDNWLLLAVSTGGPTESGSSLSLSLSLSRAALLRNLIGPLLQPHLQASYCLWRVHPQAIIVEKQFRSSCAILNTEPAVRVAKCCRICELNNQQLLNNKKGKKTVISVPVPKQRCNL